MSKWHQALNIACGMVIGALMAAAIMLPTGIPADMTLHRALNYARGWQTLLSALAAVIAATIAYRAAIAKVDFDRAQVIKADIRAAFGLQIKLRYAIARFVDNIENIRGYITPGSARYENFYAYELAITYPDEFAEVWQHTSFLPGSVISFVDSARRLLPKFETVATDKNPIGVALVFPLGEVAATADELILAGRDALAALDFDIAKKSVT